MASLLGQCPGITGLSLQRRAAVTVSGIVEWRGWRGICRGQAEGMMSHKAGNWACSKHARSRRICAEGRGCEVWWPATR